MELLNPLLAEGQRAGQPGDLAHQVLINALTACSREVALQYTAVDASLLSAAAPPAPAPAPAKGKKAAAASKRTGGPTTDAIPNEPSKPARKKLPENASKRTRGGQEAGAISAASTSLQRGVPGESDADDK